MPVEFKDYYKILGVSRTAGADEIRKSFRKLAREYHPDVAKDKRTAEEKFKEINEAYEVIGDPEKRKKYDTLGPNFDRAGGGYAQPGGGPGRRSGTGGPGGDYEFRFGGTGFSEFFEQFFGGNGGDWSRTDTGNFRRSAPFENSNLHHAPGGDIEADLMVTIEEAFHGSVRSITLERVDPRGGVIEPHTFRVRIPAGVHEGQTIRVAGKGEIAPGGGKAGDLYLRVRLAKHPDLRSDGVDLIHDLDIAPWEAVLGATVEVPVPEGKISLKIPPGSIAGQRLRVRDRGLPKPGGGRGDLYAVITIQVPPRCSNEEKKLWEELAKGSSFNPRKSTAEN